MTITSKTHFHWLELVYPFQMQACPGPCSNLWHKHSCVSFHQAPVVQYLRQQSHAGNSHGLPTRGAETGVSFLSPWGALLILIHAPPLETSSPSCELLSQTPKKGLDGSWPIFILSCLILCWSLHSLILRSTKCLVGGPQGDLPSQVWLWAYDTKGWLIPPS